MYCCVPVIHLLLSWRLERLRLCPGSLSVRLLVDTGLFPAVPCCEKSPPGPSGWVCVEASESGLAGSCGLRGLGLPSPAAHEGPQSSLSWPGLGTGSLGPVLRVRFGFGSAGASELMMLGVCTYSFAIHPGPFLVKCPSRGHSLQERCHAIWSVTLALRELPGLVLKHSISRSLSAVPFPEWWTAFR